MEQNDKKIHRILINIFETIHYQKYFSSKFSKLRLFMISSMHQTNSNFSRNPHSSISIPSFISLKTHPSSISPLFSQPSLHPSHPIEPFYTRPTSLISLTQFQKIKQKQLDLDPHLKYLQIVYSCMVYVRKQEYRRIDDDGMLILSIRDYVELEVDVKAKNSIGNKILKNGYFLVAYAILMGRVMKSRVMVEYLLKEFVCFFQVNRNEEDLSYYSKMYLGDKMRMTEFDGPEKKVSKRKKPKRVNQPTNILEKTHRQ